MEENFLKGNFAVKNPVKIEEAKEASSLREELKKKVLGTLGGNMVYMERTNLTWDGDQNDAK